MELQSLRLQELDFGQLHVCVFIKNSLPSRQRTLILHLGFLAVPWGHLLTLKTY